MSDLKLMIAVPTAGRVPMGFAYSLAGMVACVGSRRIPTLPEATVEIRMQVCESSNWIENREQLALGAISSGMTHLMFLDDDMVFEPTILETLLGRRQQIVVTNYMIKTEPAAEAEFVAVALDGKRRIPTTHESTGLEPIAYSGFGVSLFDVEVFKRTERPLFQLDYDPETGKYTTEDNPFFRRARQAGFTVYLDHDASKMVSHMGSKAWNWRESKVNLKVSANG